jgi:hypothetical protein
LWIGGGAVVALAVFVVVMLRRRYFERMVDGYADKIIRQLQARRGSEFTYASRFEVVENNPLFRHWGKVVRRVDENPAIIALNSRKGRRWRADPARRSFE